MKRSRGVVPIGSLLLALACAAGSGCDDATPSAPATSTTATTDAAAPGDPNANANANAITDAGSSDAARGELRVLFVGNSYTFVNDVPGLLTRIAATAGTGPLITTESVVKGGAFLLDHVQAGIAAARIHDGGFTHVVLQEQSSWPAIARVEFLANARTLADEAVAAGSRPTWFVTWARAPHLFESPSGHEPFFDAAEMQDRVTSAYDEAYRQSPGSLLSCVGEAFRVSLREHPEISLHQADDSHATLAGSYLAASTFYVALGGGPVPPASEVPDGLDPKTAAALRSAARVGADCAEVRTRAMVDLTDLHANEDHFEADGGVANPYDYGSAGVPIDARFRVTNRGELPAEVTRSRVNGPFAWSGDGFPGGATFNDAGTTPFCTTELAAGASCLLSVRFMGEASGLGDVSLELTGAYRSRVSRTLQGARSATGRALLTVDQSPLAGEASLSPAFVVFYGVGAGQIANVIVTNRGDAETTSIGEIGGIGETDGGALLPSPLVWGATGAEGFPGGSGVAPASFDPSVVLPYCPQVLRPGEQCLLGIGLLPTDSFYLERSVSLAYADAKGPATAPFDVAIVHRP